MANEAFFTQGGSYTSGELRTFLAAIWFKDAPGGVIWGLTPRLSGGGVVIDQGAAVVLDGSGGLYVGVTSSTSSVLTVSTSPGTYQVYAEILDPGSGATAGEMSFGIGSSVPASLAISLGTVTVASAGTQTLGTGARKQVVLQGVEGRYALATTVSSQGSRLTSVEASVATLQGAPGSTGYVIAPAAGRTDGVKKVYRSDAAVDGHHVEFRYTGTHFYLVAYNETAESGIPTRVNYADAAGSAPANGGNASTLGGYSAAGIGGSHGHDVSGASVNFANSCGTANVLSGSGPTRYFGPAGVTNAAIGTSSGTQTWLRIDTAGNFFTSGPSTSSRRFKKQIEDMEPVDAEALLDLVPKTFVFDASHPDVDQTLEDEGRQPGLIAEEVSEAGGLDDLVLFDAAGDPIGVRYDKIAVALLPVLKAQRDQIAALTARLDALEAAAGA